MATTASYDALQQRQEDLIRKALEGSIFAAPHDSDPITAMTTGAAGDLATLPDGYVDLGWTDKKLGATWTRKPDTSDVESWGASEPTRRDITKDQRSLHFMMQETKMLSLQMYEGVDLSSTFADSTTSEVAFDAPSRPATIYYRIFGLFVDGAGTDTVYVGRFMPKANITDLDDSVWSDTDDPVGYDVTLSANYDSDEGTSMRFFFGGPGWQKMLADTGFTAGT